LYKLIIVDEPTAGLDPGERNRFYNLLADVGKEVIVILSTHIVDDVRELCTKMAIMNFGEIVYHGAPQSAIDDLSGRVFQKIVARGFEQVTPNLEDVFFSKINTSNVLV